MIQKCVAFLRKRDESTDAVEEYSCHIGEPLTAHDSDSQLTRVIWAEQGCGLPVIPFTGCSYDMYRNWFAVHPV